MYIHNTIIGQVVKQRIETTRSAVNYLDQKVNDNYNGMRPERRKEIMATANNLRDELKELCREWRELQEITNSV